MKKELVNSLLIINILFAMLGGCIYSDRVIHEKLSAFLTGFYMFGIAGLVVIGILILTA